MINVVWSVLFAICLNKVCEQTTKQTIVMNGGKGGKRVPVQWFTVNSEIFARVLFSQNLTYASFMKIKPLRIGEITLSFIDVGKSSFSCEFLTS